MIDNSTIVNLKTTCAYECSLSTSGKGLFFYCEMKESSETSLSLCSIVKSQSEIINAEDSIFQYLGNFFIELTNFSTNRMERYSAIELNEMKNISILFTTFAHNFARSYGTLGLGGIFCDTTSCNIINNTYPIEHSGGIIYQYYYILTQWYHCIFFHNHITLFKCYDGFFTINMYFYGCYMNEDDIIACIRIANTGIYYNYTSTYKFKYFSTFNCNAEDTFPERTPFQTLTFQPTLIYSPIITPTPTIDCVNYFYYIECISHPISTVTQSSYPSNTNNSGSMGIF